MTKPTTIARYEQWLRDGAATAPTTDVLEYIKAAVKGLDHAAVYMSVCPPPKDLGGPAREAMERRVQFVNTVRGILQGESAVMSV